ncbi:MAG: hypothetical protein A2162_07300 [Deltaproteobacteria bacterium RBG_13_52_11b]|nr:MAG: hypothetical protein A2162_07300 [Deltaproteobacteria bacterium RBG_13_52_11b]
MPPFLKRHGPGAKKIAPDLHPERFASPGPILPGTLFEAGCLAHHFGTVAPCCSVAGFFRIALDADFSLKQLQRAYKKFFQSPIILNPDLPQGVSKVEK